MGGFPFFLSLFNLSAIAKRSSESRQMASLVPGFRRVAFQAPSRLFACNHCLLRQTPRRSGNGHASRVLNLVRSRAYATEAQQSTSPLGQLAQKMSSRSPHATATEHAIPKNRFPETSSKGVAYWLLGSAASVFGIVVFGGLTRLTESGSVSSLKVSSSIDR